MLLTGNVRSGLGICLLLLALSHEATGQRRRKGRRNNNRLRDDGGNGNYLYDVYNFGGEGRSIDPDVVKEKVSRIRHSTSTAQDTQLKGPLLYCFSSIYYRSQIYTNMSPKCLARNTKQIMHCSIP